MSVFGFFINVGANNNSNNSRMHEISAAPIRKALLGVMICQSSCDDVNIGVISSNNTSSNKTPTRVNGSDDEKHEKFQVIQG